MCYHLTTKQGSTEAVIDDNCGISKFYAIADTLAADLQINFLNQVDDAESLEWDFSYKNQLLTLHYNIFNGVSILPQSSLSISPKKGKMVQQQNNAVMEIAHFLERRAY
jgi:hypothetical protein